jgi:hypothetical protein
MLLTKFSPSPLLCCAGFNLQERQRKLQEEMQSELKSETDPIMEKCQACLEDF